MHIGELRGKLTRPIEAENNRPYKRQFSEDEAESDSSSALSSVSSTIVRRESATNIFLVSDDSDADSDAGSEVEEIIFSDDEAAESYVDVETLSEPNIVGKGSGKTLSTNEWASARKLVDDYRAALRKTRRLYE
jgi:hypothetical protein